MDKPRRIYLDNAATSWPKPESVYAAVEEYQRSNGRGLGRTTGSDANDVAGCVARLREELKQLIGAKTAEIVFTFNGTDSLNLAIQGTLKPGDHVITTTAEHNSVLRPLKTLEDSGVISVTRVGCDANGQVAPDVVLGHVNSSTRLVAITHCSNVTGILNPISEIGAGLASTEALFLVDAAQSLGSKSIEFDDSQIDLLASPGHKGLFGPLGTGVLAVSPKAQQALRPIRQGGTGASSESDVHPQSFPDGYETGNHNVPGLVGLHAGVQFVNETGLEKIAERKQLLAQNFLNRIVSINGVEVVAADAGCPSGVVSFNLSIPAAELAAILDSSFGIQIRAGYHCASLIHPYIGTHQGCARVSFGYFNSEEDSNLAAQAIEEISKAF